MIMVRYADDIVVGFQHEDDARRFWDAMRDRLRAFSLTLHPEKTRLIEFGRFAVKNRALRGLGKRSRNYSGGKLRGARVNYLLRCEEMDIRTMIFVKLLRYRGGLKCRKSTSSRSAARQRENIRLFRYRSGAMERALHTRSSISAPIRKDNRIA